MDSFDQFAASKISGIDMPACAAAEVEAPRTECALNMEGSIPALVRAVLIHLAIVALVAGLTGLVVVRNSEPLGRVSLLVRSQYLLSVSTGQILGFSENIGKK